LKGLQEGSKEVHLTIFVSRMSTTPINKLIPKLKHLTTDDGALDNLYHGTTRLSLKQSS
jgi:hypothetical protein